MKCPNCRKSLDEDSKFCNTCGKSLNNAFSGKSNFSGNDIENERKIFSKRSGLRVVLTTILSSGIYGLYWINCTLHNLERWSKKDSKHDSITWRMIIPIYNIFIYGKFLNYINKLKAESGIKDKIGVGSQQILFFLGYLTLGVTSLISIGVVQGHVNKLMDKISNARAKDAKWHWGEITVIVIGVTLLMVSFFGES